MNALLLCALLVPSAAAQEGSRKYFYEDIFTPFFEKDASGERYTAVRPSAAEGSFAVTKPANGYRVFVLGGSIAYRHMTGSGHLGTALQAAMPGKTVEVLACGMPGYDSFREALVLEEVLEYEPDLVVLMSGHNEAVGSPPVPLWLLKAHDKAAKIRAFLGKVAPLPPPNRAGKAAVLRRDADFDSNVRQMVRRAKARGVPLLLMVPPLNRTEAPVNLPAPLKNPRFLSAYVGYLRGEEKAGEFDAALKLADAPSPEERHYHAFYKARSLERAKKDATRAYDEALGQAALDRCAPPCQDRLRRIAAEEGALLADVPALFPKSAGLDAFDDAVHWRDAYNPVVSAALVHAILPRSPRSEAKPGPPKPEEILKTLHYAGREMALLDGELSLRAVAFLGWARTRAPELFNDEAELASHAWSNPPFGAEAERPGPERWLAVVRWHLGTALLEAREPKRALEVLARATSAPDMGKAWATRALAEHIVGEEKAARASLEQAKAEGGREEAEAARVALNY